jgi:predicted nucleotidyltransferase component of viral defense system
MNTISRCGTRFFLTGGTALSRAYYHHRYSDDLDFFVNDDAEYAEQLKLIFSRLREDGFFWDTTSDFISDKAFTTLKVHREKSEFGLKLDFVNDVAAHFGETVKTELFDRTDSIRNMLSNKLTALFRFAGKDVADVREIALHEPIDWRQAIQEAQHKEMGIEIPVICDILQGIPEQEFDSVNWIQKPSWRAFRNDIEKIVFDMMSGQ